MAEAFAPSGTVYLNGRIVPAAQAQVGVNDHGLLYGLGFFETFRTGGGRAPAWSRHWTRLSAACARAGIDVPPNFVAVDERRLTAVLQSLLAQHGLPDAVFRYTVAAGSPSPDGLYRHPMELLTLRALPPPAPPEGIALRALALARDTGEWRPRPKSLNFANALLGGAELRRRATRSDDEGLFLTREGFVVEAVRHNVAWVKGGRLFYPDPELGAVAGTTLAWLQERIPTAQAARIELGGFSAADAVFVLNAVRGVTPVSMLWSHDDRTVLARWNSPADPLVRDLRRQAEERFRAPAAPG